MLLSENEMKQIEQDARKYVADSWNVSEEVINLECTHVMLRYEGYIAGATAQAEKYQSANRRPYTKALPSPPNQGH